MSGMGRPHARVILHSFLSHWLGRISFYVQMSVMDALLEAGAEYGRVGWADLMREASRLHFIASCNLYAGVSAE